MGSFMANHCTALDDEFPFRMRASSGMFGAADAGARQAVRISDAPSRESGDTCLSPTKDGTPINPSNRHAVAVTAGGHLTACRYDRTPSPPKFHPPWS